jgi:hypothetical protein
VKYADDFTQLAKKEAVLQGMSDRTIDIIRSYRMEINVDKSR